MLGWTVIGGMFLLALRAYVKDGPSDELGLEPLNEDEIDPTRWNTRGEVPMERHLTPQDGREPSPVFS